MHLKYLWLFLLIAIATHFESWAIGLISSKPIILEGNSPSEKPIDPEALDEIKPMTESCRADIMTAQFTPPQGWRFADKEALPKHVRLMVVGQGEHPFPPSMNLGVESYSGSCVDYLQVVKAINKADGAEWRDLGSIETAAGTASLSQVDTSTEWGKVRMMHVILVQEGTAYILTAAALREEFSKFYPQFFQAMQSFKLVATLSQGENSPK